MAKENDKEFLEYIVKELVDNPKDVKVERKEVSEDIENISL